MDEKAKVFEVGCGDFYIARSLQEMEEYCDRMKWSDREEYPIRELSSEQVTQTQVTEDDGFATVEMSGDNVVELHVMQDGPIPGLIWSENL